MTIGEGRDGFYYPFVCYEVLLLTEDGETVGVLGMGGRATTKFYSLAKAGIPGGEAAFEDICGMCVKVKISGANLFPFLREHYPEKYEEFLPVIDRTAVYIIDCMDLS